MSTDLHTTLKDAAPRHVTPLDLGRAKRQGTRRRRTRRAAAGTAVAASLALVIGVGVNLPRGEVRIDGTDLAGPVDGSSVDWDALDRTGALDRLGAIATEHAALPQPAAGEFSTRHVVNVSWHGGTQQAAVLQVGEAAVRVDDAGRVESYERALWQLEPGADLDEIIAALSAVPAPGDDGWTPGLLPGLDADEAALAESVQLADGPAEPQPGSTERPDAAYALIRLGDGLRHGPTDPDVLLAAYDVLGTVDGRWVEYRGTVTDGLGRTGIGFAAHDPANDEDTVFVFDPDTGRLFGTLGVLEVSGDAWIASASAITYEVTS